MPMFLPSSVSFKIIFVVPVAVVWGQVVGETYNVENGTTVLIMCKIATRNDYPKQYGPPSTNGYLRLYNFEGLSTFFTSLVNYDRLSWGSNNKDLVLSDVVREDEGLYGCFTLGAGRWTVQLNIRGRTVKPRIVYVFTLH